jgi:glycosyltransferase involved in cell wall biosynthesis
VGRLSAIKDLGTLIKAVHTLRRHGYDARCALVGASSETDQPYVDSLRRLVQELDLDGTVQFTGGVRNEQLVAWYRKSFAHVNLCPTGALDKAVLEAMACERPSLVANEGFRETLNGWGERLLFRHGDPDDLVEKLDRLLQMQDGERAAMSADLRKNVIARHNLEHLAKKLVGTFEEIAGL